ncbi:MAG: TonB-dependent receptor domain-containing protein, partial [Pyrinomonadaceae bacterium]
IKKDKSFFFFSYEGRTLRAPFVGITDVPSLHARLASPPPLAALLNAFPIPNGGASPNGPNGFSTFASSYSNPDRLDSAALRFDDYLTENLAVKARYNFASGASDERGSGAYSLNTIRRLRTTMQTLYAGFSHSLSPSVVVEATGNYSRFTLRNSSRIDDFGGALVPSSADIFSTIFASTNGASIVNLTGRNAAIANLDDVLLTQRQVNLVGSLTAISGNHTVKFGADYRRMSPILGVQPLEQSVLFNGITQALTGVASRFSNFTRNGPQRPVFNYLSLYGQDSWKINSRMTVTYGLRWDLNPPPSEENGLAALALNGSADPAQIGLAPQGTQLWRTTFGNFAPRAGVAYEV